jgi:hypothetical protein
VRIATLGLMATTLGGCASVATSPPASSGIDLPTYGSGDAYPAALATGTVERSGPCVVLRGTTDHLLIWPAGTVASVDNREMVITSPAGPTLHEHQQVSIGGGEYREADFPRSTSAVPDACRGYLFWLADPGWK